MGFWELTSEAVDVIENAVGFVGVLLVKLVRVEGFVVELAVLLDQLLWNLLGWDGFSLDLRD